MSLPLQVAIHALVSPITDALKEMVKKAVRGWKKGDQKAATLRLREVMDMAEADAGCRRAYEQVRDTIPTDLESKAKWVRRKPFIIAGAVALGLFLLLGVAVSAYSVMRAKRGPVPPPPGAFGPRDRTTPPGGSEKAILVEFRQRSVTVAKGGTAKLRLSVHRLGGTDGDVTVRLDAGRGLTVPAQVIVGRGQEELEIEVRAGDEAGLFVLKATVVPEHSAPLPAECRITVGGPGGDRPSASPGTPPSERPATPAPTNPVVAVKTSLGDFKIELFEDKAPNSVGHFLSYVREEWFDGTIFHVAVRDCDIQAGVLGKDMQSKKAPRLLSKRDANGLKNEPGTVNLANWGHFYVNVGNNAGWRKECVIGRVIEGMDVVKKINAGETTKVGGNAAMPVKPVTIISIRREPGGR